MGANEAQLLRLAEKVPILFEDNHVLVISKPVNMPTQEDESRDPDLLTVLKAGIKVRYGKPGNVYLGLVHRLDRPVGGAMVFARTSKAASRLSDAVRTRSFRKTYFAVVHGKPEPAQGTLIHYLIKDTKTNTVRTAAKGEPDAKEATLDYRTLATADGLSLIEVHLHTGRPHQIRVQFASVRCPLYGDQRYGGTTREPGRQIALWSVMVGFEHPTLKQDMQFVSAPPPAYPWTLWQGSIGDFLEQVH